jgi:metal transporter CNNM
MHKQSIMRLDVSDFLLMSLSNQALPIFLNSLLNTFFAILISVTLILMFGEIAPQAICSRFGLAVGSAMAPVVRVLLVIFFPVAYPISKLLDLILGKGHDPLFRRAELKTLVDMHGNAVRIP